MLLRTRLLDLLDDSRERLVIICADSGYGKTTLMGQFYRMPDGPSIWYELGKNDTDIAVFLAHLIEAVSLEIPGFDERVDGAIATGVKATDWESILTVMVNEFAGAAERPMNFFFDEFEAINEGKPVRDAIDFLIKYLPSGFRVFIASREKLTMSLGRMRAQRTVLEMNTDDLRFTSEETTSLFEGCCSDPLSDSEIELWQSATEGWPIALSLSQHLLKSDCRLPEDLSPDLLGEQGTVREYLAEEYWSSLDDAQKIFIMKTSLLDTVEVEICDQVLGTSKEEQSPSILLQELERRNHIISLEGGRSYRYHNLARDFLRIKLEQHYSTEHIAGLQRRYGQAYADRGNYEQAISHFLRAGSPELAGDVIESFGQTIMESDRFSTLADWITDLPEELIRNRPWLAYFAARASEFHGDLTASEAWYRLAEEGFARDGDSHGSFICALGLSEFFFMQNKDKDSLEKAEQAIGCAVTQADKVRALSRAAQQNLLLGWTAEASRMMHEASSLCDDSMAQTRLALEVDALAPRWLAGDFAESFEHVMRLQSEFGPSSPMFARFQILCFKVFLLYELARYEEALGAIEERHTYLESGDKLQQMTFDYIKGVVLLNVGDGRKGFRLLRKLDRQVSEGKKLLGPFYSSHNLGAYLRARNDLEGAMRENSRGLKSFDEDSRPYALSRILVNMGANRMRLSPGNPDAGIDLDRAQRIASKHGFKIILTQVHFHRAWRALETGDEEEALAQIRKSLEIAAQHQHNNFIVQEGSISTKLLALAFENNIERAYLAGLFAQIGPVVVPDLAPLLRNESSHLRISAIDAIGAAGGVKAVPVIHGCLRDPDPLVRRAANAELARLRDSIDEPEKILTSRENEVMAFLAEGSSNAEIAGQLFISEPTVKTHVTRIFRKLGLTRRSQAAAYFPQTRHHPPGTGNASQ